MEYKVRFVCERLQGYSVNNENKYGTSLIHKIKDLFCNEDINLNTIECSSLLQCFNPSINLAYWDAVKNKGFDNANKIIVECKTEGMLNIFIYYNLQIKRDKDYKIKSIYVSSSLDENALKKAWILAGYPTRWKKIKTAPEGFKILRVKE